MQQGTVYYFTQAGIERSKRFATLQEAQDDVFFVMQRHNPKVTVRKAIAGQRGSEIVQTLYANCYKG
jgi:hypothetical protein